MRILPLPNYPWMEGLPGPLPSWEEMSAGLHVVELPMNLTFRGVRSRAMVLVRGPRGWGEFSPFEEYGDAECVPWLASAVEAAWGGFPAVAGTGVSVPVNGTVPAVAARDVPRVMDRFDGVDTFKVKVAEPGGSLDDDLARVWAARRHRPDAALRVDANGGWTLRQAQDALPRLAEAGLQYAEQPVARVEDMARLREGLAGSVALAADENIRKAGDPARVVLLGAADVIVVKAAPLGGVAAAARLVRRLGLPTVVSSALDSSVGLARGALLAAVLAQGSPGQREMAHGLGTAEFLAGDVAEPSCAPRGGRLAVGAPHVDPELVERHAASPERRLRWLERTRRVHALLVGGAAP